MKGGSSQTRHSPNIKLARVLVSSLDTRALRIPTTIRINQQETPVKALIDSGADTSLISKKLVEQLQIPRNPINRPISARNADGTLMKDATITHSVTLPLRVGTETHPTKLLVATIGDESIILGHPWLQQHNPAIDWTQNALHTNQVTTQTSNQKDTATILQIATHDGELRLPDNVPPLYQEYTSLFQKKAAERFPPERPYDHCIDLKPDFKPSDCPVYSLTPRERAAHDEFISENLRKGFIRPSKSPQASPFFFVPKKDPNDLRPCQDYRRLNAGTI